MHGKDSTSFNNKWDHLGFLFWNSTEAIAIGRDETPGTISYEADLFSGKIGLPNIHGENRGTHVNAFRHALWQAIITQRFGQYIAIEAGLAHEGRSSTKEAFLLIAKLWFRSSSWNDTVDTVLTNFYFNTSFSKFELSEDFEVFNGVVDSPSLIGFGYDNDDYFNDKVYSLDEADQIVDLLNNTIGMKIGNYANKKSTPRDIAFAILDEFNRTGLYMAEKLENGNFRIIKKRIDTHQWNRSWHILKSRPDYFSKPETALTEVPSGEGPSYADGSLSKTGKRY